jgi:hypothetical protein
MPPGDRSGIEYNSDAAWVHSDLFAQGSRGEGSCLAALFPESGLAIYTRALFRRKSDFAQQADQLRYVAGNNLVEPTSCHQRSRDFDEESVGACQPETARLHFAPRCLDRIRQTWCIRLRVASKKAGIKIVLDGCGLGGTFRSGREFISLIASVLIEKEYVMNGIIYLVGLVVVVGVILSFLGLR